jgi:3-oxoacyl-[acyl-carrier protein] reductase/7-alpha-hydroxysteroid dehydrogenase
MEITLKGKVAVVTGGTRGIGYAVVRKYLEAGASVALFGSRQCTADAALERITSESPGANVMALSPDLTDSASVEGAFGEVVKRFGRIDILVNNAGISQSLPLNEYSDEEMDKILDLNLKAVFVCCRAAARLMEASGGGVILNTSSVVSLYGQPSGCLYPTTKFAVNGLTKSLSRELAPRGIRVNAVAPGVTRTDMVANLPEAMIKPLVARIPIGRVGEPDEVADAFLFLASDMASYITGAVLPVDGGVII